MGESLLKRFADVGDHVEAQVKSRVEPPVVKTTGQPARQHCVGIAVKHLRDERMLDAQLGQSTVTPPAKIFTVGQEGEEVAVGLLIAPRGAEPGVFRADMVEHRVHYQPHPALVQPVDQLLEYVLVAEHWIYGLIVDGVVLMVRVCSENWRQVHSVGTKVLQVVKMINDAAKVSTKEVAAAGGLLIPAGVPSIAVALIGGLGQLGMDIERLPDRKALGKDLINQGEDLPFRLVLARNELRSPGTTVDKPRIRSELHEPARIETITTALIRAPRRRLCHPAVRARPPGHVASRAVLRLWHLPF